MSRVCMAEDVAAQICWRYFHGGFDGDTNETIYTIVHSIIPDKAQAIRMLFEIAYRIGYAKSQLQTFMGEITYKLKKKWIRDTIESELRETFEKSITEGICKNL